MCENKLPSQGFRQCYRWQTLHTDRQVTRRPVTWQRWQSYHWICHTRKPHAARKPHGAILFKEPELRAIEVYIVRIGIFEFFAPVTLTVTRWPSYKNRTRTPWRYTGCANMEFLRQGFRKLSSNRQTERQTRWRSHHWASHTRKTHTTRKPAGSIFHRTGVRATWVYIAGIGIFDFFLFVWPWPWPYDIHIRTWPVLPGDTPNMQTSYVKAFENNRLTDIQTDRQVTCGHLRSRDKDGGHIIQSAVVTNSMIRANLMALSFIKPELWATKLRLGRQRQVWFIPLADKRGVCR